MKRYGAFDIIGPIMIGPSSSHTAGAARLGRVAKSIAGGDFSAVTFYLHGSFEHTYRGHGTDKALVAGILGMKPHDDGLRNAMEIAEEKGIKIEFLPIELENAHPNTAKIVFHKNDGTKVEVIGSSIGGGSIKINGIEGYDVDLTGEYPAVIIRQNDKKGVISDLSRVLANNNINIATMNVSRSNKGKEAFTIIECDGVIPVEAVREMEKLDNIISVKSVNPITD
ncbi:L-serine ammonia-lyase, iron-sulfur-dependent subunit beta [Hathewaya histolytica]|uniref:L-serine deaminase n=1 Tax=Hathewaya histolytica TaxID=1498 RepID=A0A4U9R0H8_HATHI|nr:L-serine ammonia-lyase, iron-sulfur-dependent subunit beta [Hathewaya histolytica]VTQ84565.1 L-serine dehydratase beta subunit [Hathewaya histolytica]